MKNIQSNLKQAVVAIGMLAAIGTAGQAIAQDGVEIEEVFVLGSRAPGRTAGDLPVPVDSLSSESMEATGQTEVGRMLQVLAPSFNFSSSSISDGTDALRPATLRGLGPDQTLVLVNGKRRHQASLIHINGSVGRGTAGTDMNAIPASSIKRIEVLRDGAAAQYGSDAIGGVINIILNDDDEAGHLSISQGQTSEGDGATTNINLSKGFAFGESGFINAALNLRDREATNRADPTGRCLYSSPRTLCLDTDGNGYFEPAAGNEAIEVNSPARDGFRIGDSDSEQTAFTLNAGTDLGDGELYGFVTYSTRDNESGAFYREPISSNGQENALLTDGFNPADADGFLPLIQSEIEDLSYNIGYRLDTGPDTTVDISYTSGKNTIDYTTANSANFSFANFLQFGQGLTDAEVRAQLPRSAKAYGLELELTTLNIDITHQFDRLSLAAGAEHRTDTYVVTAGDQYSYFDYDSDPVTGAALYAQNAGASISGFNGIAPASEVDEDRNVISVYVDGEYEVSSDWLISAAARFDEYDGFGDTVNVKLATSFQLTDTLRVRGATSTGFRAPSMQQLYFNNISTQINGGVSSTVGTFRNDSAVVQALGVPELTEESSTNYSFGIVADLAPGWNVTFDYYAIDIDDRIALSNRLSAGNDPVVGGGALTAALVASDIDRAQFFLNGMNTETRGFDIVSTYNGVEMAGGSVDFTVAANFTETDVTDIFVPDSGAISGLDADVVISSGDISIIEEWQPQDRINASALYSRDDWTVNLSLNRYGEYTTEDSGTQTYSPEILTDLFVKYRVNEQISVNFTGNNIFDVTPDEATNGLSRGGLFESAPGAEDMGSDSVFRYSRRSAPFGFNGAFYSLGVSYDF